MIVGVEPISISISFCSILLKFVFSFYMGIWSWIMIFFFFLCSWNWSMSTFCSLCFIFLVGFVISFTVGLFLVFISYWVPFGVFWCLFWCRWLFHQNLLCPLGWICWIMGLVHLLVFLVKFGFFPFFALGIFPDFGCVSHFPLWLLKWVSWLSLLWSFPLGF